MNYFQLLTAKQIANRLKRYFSKELTFDLAVNYRQFPNECVLKFTVTVQYYSGNIILRSTSNTQLLHCRDDGRFCRDDGRLQ